MCRITVITSLFKCQPYLEGYFKAAAQIVNKDEIEILLIHNAPLEEELKIVNSYLNTLTFIKHIIVEREGLYATWNRGIKMAKGKYITTWNVDDVRLPNSLLDQAAALDKDDKAALAYGDFTIVNSYGSTEGKTVNEPGFDVTNPTFQRQHHIGCFPMWRRSIHDRIGYFDEQFRLIADFDFQIRVAKTFAMVKIDQPLGYYLEGTASNLSSNFLIQEKEHTVLHLRYGNFSMLFLTHLISGIKDFELFRYKWYGSFHAMADWTPVNKLSYLAGFPKIIVSVLNFPRHLARKYIKKHLNKYKQQVIIKAQSA
jgi:glycosyltransferase involved in cell wall biosynthesis